MLGKDWTRVDIEEIAWRPSGDGRFQWFEPQNHRVGRFPGLGLKTGGVLGVVKVWWRARIAIAKLVSRQSEVVKEAIPSMASIK